MEQDDWRQLIYHTSLQPADMDNHHQGLDQVHVTKNVEDYIFQKWNYSHHNIHDSQIEKAFPWNIDFNTETGFQSDN